MPHTLSLLWFVLLLTVFIGLGKTDGITYEKFHVDSVIVSRYARTVITSVLLNMADISQEVTFRVELPDTAFISNFTMEVNGTLYLGLADEKDKASTEYRSRKDQGQNVGLVESMGGNVFGISINTAAGTRSTFVLTYEELITRSLSKYQQIITLKPGSFVADLHVSIRVIDSQGILHFNGSSFVNSKRLSDKEVVFTYSPSLLEQNDYESGLLRNMFIEYDVNYSTDKSAGLIIVNDCYFAQFFSPKDAPTIPVDIVFVVDVSGSMKGRKIYQAKESLSEVISQLNDHDYFSVVAFSDSVNIWSESLVSVAKFREEGKAFVSGLNAGGCTNFNEAMITSITILRKSTDSNHVQLLVMLSDGEPTIGITSPNMIVDTATAMVSNTRISLNMIGFGVNLNLLLLQRLAIANRGIVKQIFEGKDAAGQLEGFYMSISSPIFHSLTFNYPSKEIETISNVEAPLLFKGSEIVVAGKFSDDACVSGAKIPVTVNGMGATSEQTFTSDIDPTTQTVIAGIKPNTERLVAYLHIQQLLRSLKVSSYLSNLRKKALTLAMKYNFVTELTSLIVVEESVVRKIPSENFSIPDDIPHFEISTELDHESHIPSCRPILTGMGPVQHRGPSYQFPTPLSSQTHKKDERQFHPQKLQTLPSPLFHTSLSPSRHQLQPLIPPISPRVKSIIPLPQYERNPLNPSPFVKTSSHYAPHQPNNRHQPLFSFPTTTANINTTTTENILDIIHFYKDQAKLHSSMNHQCTEYSVVILIFHVFHCVFFDLSI